MIQKIIVNADDFGYNSSVNKAIIQGIDCGYITSATIMACGDAFDNAIDYAKQRSDVSFGVHLCIDDFKPMSSEDVFKKYGLVDNSGKFIKFAYLNLKETDEIKEAIYSEWKAQISKVKETGLSISHIDSHHHAHTHSFFYKIVYRLSIEFGLGRVRICLYKPLLIKLRERQPISLQESSNSQSNNNLSLLRIITNNIYLGLLSFRFKRRYSTTEFFCPLRYFMANKSLLSRYKSIELMTHPGLPYYQNETELLPLLRQDDSLSFISYLEL